jgi:hypothetical protein
MNISGTWVFTIDIRRAAKLNMNYYSFINSIFSIYEENDTLTVVLVFKIFLLIFIEEKKIFTSINVRKIQGAVY